MNTMNACISKSTQSTQSTHSAITYRNPNFNRNHTSWKLMNLTPHSKQRASERLNITNSDELKKMANSARFKGIDIDRLTIYNYESVGLTYEELVVLKKKYYRHNKTERLFYYKNFVWIFCGNNALSVRSIVPVR